VESGERSEVMLVRKDPHKAGGREQDTSHEQTLSYPPNYLIYYQEGRIIEIWAE